MKKFTYSITYYSTTNKIESVEIEATGLEFHGEDASAAACWMVGKRPVFALPFRFLIVTRIISQSAAEKSHHSKNGGLAIVR